jgi:hypothetical protein
MTDCIFCGQKVELMYVHGHYQCPICKTNALPCCDGDNCHTNILLHKDEDRQHQTPNSKLQTN